MIRVVAGSLLIQACVTERGGARGTQRNRQTSRQSTTFWANAADARARPPHRVEQALTASATEMATLTGQAGSTAVKTVQLAAKVAGVKDITFKADADAATPVLSHAKMTVTGTHTIMQFLAQQANAKQLVGSTPEEEAQARPP